MFVVGRVIDPDGKPVPGATVTASVQSKFSLGWSALARPMLDEIGHISADESGRFRVDAPRTSSSRNDAFVAIGLAPGFGVGWVKVDPDADQPIADITLEPEQIIEGRLLDIQGRPAQGVTVSAASIEHQSVRDSERRTVQSVVEGPVYDWTRVNDLPGWPKPAITDAEGRFTIHGAGRGVKVGLSTIAPHFALDVINVETDNARGAKTVTATLEPPQIFTGHVTDAETGEPVPHARLRFSANSSLPQRWFLRHTEFQADANGRFRANPSRGERFAILVDAPVGKGYVESEKSFNWPKAAVEQSLDLTLSRGAAIRGMVVEEGTDRPIPRATVTFITRPEAGANRRQRHGDFRGRVVRARCRAGPRSTRGPGVERRLHLAGDRHSRGQPGHVGGHAHLFQLFHRL